MKIHLQFAIILVLFLTAATMAAPTNQPLARWSTKTSIFSVDQSGSLSSITPIDAKKNYLAGNQPSPMLQIRVAGKWYAPDSATWDTASNNLALHYNSVDATITLNVITKPTHITFEIAKANPIEKIEMIEWGPYPTTIGDIIGEVVGVVRDPDFAIGIQALNAKTLGGKPGPESDSGAASTIADPGKYSDLPPELNKSQLFRGNTAYPAPFGSILQAFCRDRSHDRIVSNLDQPAYVAPAFDDGGILHSKIALFACPSAQALTTLGQIELDEKLPHPTLDGVWAKISPDANASYLIVDFGEDTIDRAIALTQQAGLKYLYQSSPFQTWGHFQLNPKLFPHGFAGLRACVDKANKAGIHVGFHTLSNFITPNDSYVTPIPDPRLARVGSSALTAAIDPTATEIPIEDPTYFSHKTTLNTVVIDDELIIYHNVSAAKPWKLLACQRGAWNTKAAPHKQNATIGKLMDHPYRVFLTNSELSIEVAKNIATCCNQTGIQQISMDGLEGNYSTGLGEYGRTLFALSFYNALTPALQSSMRDDASGPGHFNWHINTYYNWGEPWGAGFRQAQTLYRFKNQMFFERNYIPHMLGWFVLRPETTLADAEWLLARSAGYDAGFALAVSPNSTADQAAANSAATVQNNTLNQILAAVNQWETARLSGAFPPEVKAILRDNSREFHLELISPGKWNLYPIQSGQRGTPIPITQKH